MKILAKTPLKNAAIMLGGIVIGTLTANMGAEDCTNVGGTVNPPKLATTAQVAPVQEGPCGNDTLAGHRMTKWGEEQVVCRDEAGNSYNKRKPENQGSSFSMAN